MTFTQGQMGKNPVRLEDKIKISKNNLKAVHGNKL